jgi:hypothetical protein
MRTTTEITYLRRSQSTLQYVIKFSFVSARFSVIFLLSPENLPGDTLIKVNFGAHRPEVLEKKMTSPSVPFCIGQERIALSLF